MYRAEYPQLDDRARNAIRDVSSAVKKNKTAKKALKTLTAALDESEAMRINQIEVLRLHLLWNREATEILQIIADNPATAELMLDRIEQLLYGGRHE